MLIHDFTEYYARNLPEAVCVVMKRVVFSYVRLNAMANQTAHALHKLGVEPGDRVAVLGENSVAHLVVTLAASKSGAVAVPVNYRLAPREIIEILLDCKPRVLFLIGTQLRSVSAEFKRGLPQDTVIVHCEPDMSGAWSADDLPQTNPQGRRLAGDVVVQFYTSGTTGRPKGVLASHANLLSFASISAASLPHRPSRDTTELLCSPMFHLSGMATAIANVVGGSRMILHSGFDAYSVADDIERYRVTRVFLVPAMIRSLLDTVTDIDARDFSCLKLICYGGAPISVPELRRALEVFKCDFVQCYGMTETVGTVVNLSPDDHRSALAGRAELLKSCGRTSAGVALKIVPLGDAQQDDRAIGEIWIKAASNMVGYYNRPEETASCMTDGWVHTGDVGYLDDESYLYLLDRVKDMVVSGGENVYPIEVERLLATHPAIAEIAVIGVPDDRYGEALLAVAALRPECSLSVEELISFCRGKLAGYKIPRRLIITDALPLSATGKVLKKELRKNYWQGIGRSIG